MIDSSLQRHVKASRCSAYDIILLWLGNLLRIFDV